MFIATPYDKYGSTWTKRKPTAPILHRLALLAKQSFEVLEKQMNDTGVNMDYKVIIIFSTLSMIYVHLLYCSLYYVYPENLE